MDLPLGIACIFRIEVCVEQFIEYLSGLALGGDASEVNRVEISRHNGVDALYADAAGLDLEWMVGNSETCPKRRSGDHPWQAASSKFRPNQQT
jgi:hypothetical protein